VNGHSTPSYAQQYQQQMLYSSAQQQYLRQQQQALHAQAQMGYSAGSTEAVPIVVAQDNVFRT
jgi:transcription factor SFP1